MKMAAIVVVVIQIVIVCVIVTTLNVVWIVVEIRQKIIVITCVKLQKIRKSVDTVLSKVSDAEINLYVNNSVIINKQFYCSFRLYFH